MVSLSQAAMQVTPVPAWAPLSAIMPTLADWHVLLWYCVAYEALSDEEKRRIYDAHGEEGLKQHSAGGGRQQQGGFDMWVHAACPVATAYPQHVQCAVGTFTTCPGMTHGGFVAIGLSGGAIVQVSDASVHAAVLLRARISLTLVVLLPSAPAFVRYAASASSLEVALGGRRRSAHPRDMTCMLTCTSHSRTCTWARSSRYGGVGRWVALIKFDPFLGASVRFSSHCTSCVKRWVGSGRSTA